MTDFKGTSGLPLVVIIAYRDTEHIGLRYADGRCFRDRDSADDIINIPPEETREFWNLYERNCLGYPDKPRGFETASLPSARHETLEAALKVWVDSSAFAVLEVVRIDGEIVDTILHKREKR